MKVTWYTRETAPHEPILALSRGFSTAADVGGWHAENPGTPPSSWTCAACHWDRPDVKRHRRKVRAAAEKRLRAAERGKLPPLKTSTFLKPLFPKSFDPSRVVLPTYDLSGTVRREHERYVEAESEAVRSRTIVRRYLASVGATQDKVGNWSCGCRPGYDHLSGIHCNRHRPAIEGE
jgi:hypothetical protein